MSIKIVKIQRPLDSSEDGPPALVYDKSREYENFVHFSDDLKKAMAGRVKVYCEVEITSDGVRIIREVPAETW